MSLICNVTEPSWTVLRAGVLVERRDRLTSLVVNLLPLNSVDTIISSSVPERIVHIFCIL